MYLLWSVVCDRLIKYTYAEFVKSKWETLDRLEKSRKPTKLKIIEAANGHCADVCSTGWLTYCFWNPYLSYSLMVVVLQFNSIYGASANLLINDPIRGSIEHESEHNLGRVGPPWKFSRF